MVLCGAANLRVAAIPLGWLPFCKNGDGPFSPFCVPPRACLVFSSFCLTCTSVTETGIPGVLDACGVCNGDGKSCSCTEGYLGLSQADTLAAILCYVDGQLETQLGEAILKMDQFVAALAAQNCEKSSQLNFLQWLNSVQAFCSNSTCSITDFLNENLAFNTISMGIAPPLSSD